MSNLLFPALPGLRWGVQKIPQFNTIVQKAVGGREVRASLQPLPIWRWILSYEFLREGVDPAGAQLSEWTQLAGFFTARQGRFDSFLFEDPYDKTVADTVAARQNFGTGDGVTKSFQIGRAIGSGLFEPLFNLNGAPKVYVAGVLKAVPADYTVNSTGLVTFAAAPALGAALTWSGAYYFRVRFGEDSATYENFALLFWRNQQVILEQLLGL